MDETAINVSQNKKNNIASEDHVTSDEGINK